MNYMCGHLHVYSFIYKNKHRHTAYKKQNSQLSDFIGVWVHFLKEKSDFTLYHLSRSSFTDFYALHIILKDNKHLFQVLTVIY